jgi:putative ATP-binding cassette transporter
MTEGTKELKLHHQRRETFLNDVLNRSALALRRNSVVGMTIFIAGSSWGQLLSFILIGMLLFAVPELTNINKNIQTGYTIIILFMMAPLEIVMTILPTLGRSSVALAKVEAMGISLAKESRNDELVIADSKPSWRHLELLDVTHSYHNEQDNSSFILGPLSASFEPGEIVFMAGGNGSGKTTFAKLLTAFTFPKTERLELMVGTFPRRHENPIVSIFR